MSDLFSPVSVLSLLSLQKAQKNLNESKDYLKNDFSSLVKLLSLYNPLEVMKMSLWEERRVLSSGIKDPLKRESAVLLPIVLQSLVESNLITSFGNEINIKERDWERIKNLGEDIVRRVVRFIDSFCSIALHKGEATEESLEGMRASIASKLLPNSVNEESLEKDSWELRSLLEEINDFSERVGTDYVSFVINVQNIAKQGLFGIDNLVRDVSQYSQEYSLSEAQLKASGELDGLDPAEIFNLITERNHWEGRAKALSQRRDGYSLFMPMEATSLPKESFIPYTIDRGSLDLFAFIEMGFWPAERYPFLEYNGNIYSFVAKHMPFFLSLSSSVDRYKAASNDVLALFSLSDSSVDTYTYDGNKIEIAILPSVLDVNPVLNPACYSDIVKRRKEELALPRKLGHKKLVVDSDMKENMEKKDDVLYVSSIFMCKATVDRNAKNELLTSLLGNLDLPEGGGEFSLDIVEDEIDNTPEPSSDDIVDNEDLPYEYEYNDVDEDELAKKIDERYENLEPVEYERKKESDEELKAKIEKYSLPPEVINEDDFQGSEEEIIEETLDEDIFDDSDEEERLDDIGISENSDSEFFEAVEESDEYLNESEEEEEGVDDEIDSAQLTFFNLLDEDSPDTKEAQEEKSSSPVETEDKDEVTQESDSLVVDDVPLSSYEEEADLRKDEEEKIAEEDSFDYLADEDKDYIYEEEPSSLEEESVIENEEQTLQNGNEHLLEDEVYSLKNDDSNEKEGATEEVILDALDEDDPTLNSEESSESFDVGLDDSEEEASSEIEDILKDRDEEDSINSEEAFDNAVEDETQASSENQRETEEDSALIAEENSEPFDEGVYDSEEEASSEIEDILEDSDEEDYINSEEAFDNVNEDETQTSSEEQEETESEIDNIPEEIEEDNSLDCEEDITIFDEEESLDNSEEESLVEHEDNEEKEDVLLDNEESITAEDDNEREAVETLSDEKDNNIEGESILDNLESEPQEEDSELPKDVVDLSGEELPRAVIGVEEKSEEETSIVPSPEVDDSANEKESPKSSFEASLYDALGLNEDESVEERDDSDSEATVSYVLSDEDDHTPLHVSDEEEIDHEIEEKAEGIVYAIYKELGKNSAFADFIRDSDTGTLDELEEVIRNCWNRQQVEEKDKLFNIVDYSLSILLAHDSIRDELRMAELLNNAGGVMYSRGEEQWRAVIVYIDSSYNVEEAIEKTITKDSFSPSDWKRVTYIGEQMRKR